MVKQFIPVHQLPAWVSVIFFWIGFAALVGLVAPLSAAFPGLWKIVIEESSRPTSEIMGMIGYFGVLGLATFGFWLFHRQRLRKETSMC